MAKLIGTAGHVDHGKTTLIKALTGIDADRLPDEKRRGMTIDIGFAYIELPGVGRVSIVDVPGHEKFVTNMLVGALGIDVALLCVSCDESVMPQTREHLQILELLPVDKLVVAMTRADLADEETREIARAEVDQLVASSRFGTAPLVAVSAHTGEGLDELRNILAAALQDTTPNTEQPTPTTLPWYLPIDRAFSVKGHGCVVTGTLAQGSVKVGDEAMIEPGHTRVRVRSIHSHDEALDVGEKGRRTAINLSGVKVEEVRRGQAVGAPGALFETDLLDARVKWVGERKHGLRVRVAIGAAEALGKTFLSEHEPEIVQLRLEAPVACALNQPLIIRRYSPPDLLAGGRVVVPQAKKRKRSEALAVVSDAATLDEAIVSAIGESQEGSTTDEICRKLGKSPQALGDEFERLLALGSIKGFAGLWFRSEQFGALKGRFVAALGELHEANPTMATIPRERVLAAAGLHWSGKPLDRIVAHLVAEGELRAEGTAVRDPSFSIKLTQRQREFLDRIEALMDESGFSPPSPNELARLVNTPPQAVEEILRLGVEAGEIARVSQGVFYTSRQLVALKKRLVEIAGGKQFTASEVRDALGTSRKYVIPLLEYFDATRFTMRLGDSRVIRNAPLPPTPSPSGDGEGETS